MNHTIGDWSERLDCSWCLSSSWLLEAGIGKHDVTAVKVEADSLKNWITSSKVGGSLIERETLVHSCFGSSGMQSLRDITRTGNMAVIYPSPGLLVGLYSLLDTLPGRRTLFMIKEESEVGQIVGP